jgi:hypothetical protein
MTFTAVQMYIPLIVLGNTESDTGTKPTVNKLAIKNGRRFFAYLEMNKKSYISEIYNKLKTQLQNSGDIDPELQEEELALVMLEKFKTNIIKVTAVESKSPRVPYEREYSFIPFTNKNIGNKSGEYDAIINYEKDEELKKDAVEFLSLFEVEVDNFVKDWTDEELTKYLIDDKHRKDNVEAYIKGEEAHKVVEEQKIVPKATEEQKVVPKDNVPQTIASIMSAEPEAPQSTVVQKSEVSISEEDITFDSADDDFIDDDDFSED